MTISASKLKSKIITLVSKAFDTEEEKQRLEELKTWIACFFLKHTDESPAQFERNLMERLKMKIISLFNSCFWSVFYGKRLEYQITKKTYNFEEQREILFELDFEQFQGQKHKPRLFLFQRKTEASYEFG